VIIAVITTIGYIEIKEKKRLKKEKGKKNLREKGRKREKRKVKRKKERKRGRKLLSLYITWLGGW